MSCVSDGTGYVEDGRDIFDDEDEYEDTPTTAKAKDSKTKDGSKKRRLRDINAPEKGKSSIKSLFSNIVPKKKETTVNLNEDDILTGILDELDTGKPTSKSPKSIALQQNDRDEANVVQNYLKNFAKTTRKPIGKKSEDNTSDDEMLDRIMKPKKKENTSTSALKKIEPVNVPKSSMSVVEELGQEMLIEELAHEIPEIISAETDEISRENVVASENLSAPVDDKITDMDFSMLDDDENQFEIDTLVKEAAAVCKPAAKVDETNFDDLLANWENIENCDDDFLNVTVGDELHHDEVHSHSNLASCRT